MSMIEIAVCGAHMQGLPLNPQLLALGAEFVCTTRTTADYRLFKLPGFSPARPGLLRVTQHGMAIALEVWRLPLENYGKLVAMVPSPLCFGTLMLAQGKLVQGFLCEAFSTEAATDISATGGWRAYLESTA